MMLLKNPFGNVRGLARRQPPPAEDDEVVRRLRRIETRVTRLCTYMGVDPYERQDNESSPDRGRRAHKRKEE